MAAARTRSLPRFSQTLNTRSSWWNNTLRPHRLGSFRLTPGKSNSSKLNPAGALRLAPRACTMDSGTRIERVQDDISYRTLPGSITISGGTEGAYFRG